VILEALQDGLLTMTAVRLLAPHLTEDNHRMVLASADHSTKADVEKVVAAMSPQPSVPSIVRKLPQRKEPSTPSAGLTSTSDECAVRSEEKGGSPEPSTAAVATLPIADGQDRNPLRSSASLPTGRATIAPLARDRTSMKQKLFFGSSPEHLLRAERAVYAVP
jgi:hypothetical protein